MKWSDAVGEVHSDLFKIAVAQGKIPGWATFKKFGLNDAVTSGTEEMWPLGTARTFQSSAFVASAVSSDAADAAAGTGARTLTIQGLDENHLPVEETITMNGLTPVVTTQTFLDVNRAFNVTAGSNEVNVGNITISLNSAASAYVAAGAGQTLQTHYIVPAAKKLVVSYFNIGVGRMTGSNDLHIRSQIKLFETDAAWRTKNDVYIWNGGSYRNGDSINLIEPKTSIRQQIISTTGTQAHGVWGGFLVDEANF